MYINEYIYEYEYKSTFISICMYVYIIYLCEHACIDIHTLRRYFNVLCMYVDVFVFG